MLTDRGHRESGFRPDRSEFEESDFIQLAVAVTRITRHCFVLTDLDHFAHSDLNKRMVAPDLSDCPKVSHERRAANVSPPCANERWTVGTQMSQHARTFCRLSCGTQRCCATARLSAILRRPRSAIVYNNGGNSIHSHHRILNLPAETGTPGR